MEEPILARRLSRREARRYVDPERLAAPAGAALAARGGSGRGGGGWSGSDAVDERTATPDGISAALKNSAERAFHKAWSVLQGLRKDIMRVEDQKFKLELEIIKLNQAREKAEQQPENEREEEPVESPKMIVIYTDPEGKVIRDERVGGKVVKREEVFLE
jgi:hypothetical protein